MAFVLAFAVTLYAAVLVSDWAKKTILSSSVLFLLAGLLVGSGVGIKINSPKFDIVEWLAEFALFSVLFSDGIRTGGVGEIRKEWRLAERALLFGLPLTIAGIALVGHYLAGMTWPMAFLIGSALSPTDPVFVSAIFNVEAVPPRLKRTLNLESGMNDGLALPAVVLMLNHVSQKGMGTGAIIWNLALGVVIGIVIPWLGIRLEESRLFQAVGVFEPLLAFSLGLLVLAVCYASGANLFLAAFAGGITIASVSQRAAKAFFRFGEIISELLKLAALLVLGALLAPRLLQPLSWGEFAFIVLAVFAVRPVAIAISFLGLSVSHRETLTVGWFGPKGFASVVYGLMIFGAGIQRGAHLIGLAIILSIVVYSSTDILVGRFFERAAKQNLEDEQAA